MLNKFNLAIAALCADSEVFPRRPIRFLRIEKDKTVATDGHVLAIVTRPKTDEKQEAAILVDPEKINNPTESVIIVKDGTLSFARAVAAAKVETETKLDYPKYDSVIPSEAPAGEIVFDLKLLMKVLRIAEAHTHKSGLTKNSDADKQYVRFRFYGAEKALRFDCVGKAQQSMTALIMPCRDVSVDWSHAYKP